MDEIVDCVVMCYCCDFFCMVQILCEVQEVCDWIFLEVIDCLQVILGVLWIKIEGVVGFYFFFYFQLCGKYWIFFFSNIIDYMQGNQVLMECLCSNLWIELGKVLEDGLVSVSIILCIGMCDQGLVMLVNNFVIFWLIVVCIDQIVELVCNLVLLVEWLVELFSIEDNICWVDILLGIMMQLGDVLCVVYVCVFSDGLLVLNMCFWCEGLLSGLSGFLVVFDEIKYVNLCGCGGVGFIIGLKWEVCCNVLFELGQECFVVCNVDEGELGIFKDCVLFFLYVDLVFEGMMIVVYIIGVWWGFFYLCGEYWYLFDLLNVVFECW